MPTGSAAADFYGANRVGDNLYANSLIALNADTGKRHLALPGRAPRHLGSRLSVAAEPRHGHARRQDDRRGRAGHQARLRVRVRSRERHADVSRSSTARFRRAPFPAKSPPRRSRFPTRPAPFARQDLTPETHHHRERPRRARGRSPSWRSSATTVCSSRSRWAGDTVIFPGFDGGAEWGGSAFDPETGILLRERQRPGVDRRPGAGRRGQHARDASTCRTALRAIATICRARRRRSPSLVGIAQRKTTS